MSNLQVPERLSVYTGLNTNMEAASEVAAAVKSAGFATQDAAVGLFTLGEVGRNQNAALDSAEGSLVVLHSMGHLILEPMLKAGVWPAAIASFNRPEPTDWEYLIVGAARRLARHAVRSVTGPYARGHRLIVSGTRQSVVDTPDNLGRVPEVLPFSGDKWLEPFARLKVPTVGFIGDLDEFGADYRKQGDAKGVQYAYRRSCHDLILFNPRSALEAIGELGVLSQIQ